MAGKRDPAQHRAEDPMPRRRPKSWTHSGARDRLRARVVERLQHGVVNVCRGACREYRVDRRARQRAAMPRPEGTVRSGPTGEDPRYRMGCTSHSRASCRMPRQPEMQFANAFQSSGPSTNPQVRKAPSQKEKMPGRLQLRRVSWGSDLRCNLSTQQVVFIGRPGDSTSEEMQASCARPDWHEK